MPVWPSLQLWIKKHLTSEQQSLKALAATDSQTATSTPEDNRVVIPELLLNQPILEGRSVYTVDKGVWRPPYSSTPDKGGNTILIGHRFTYSSPAVFYHLDLLRPADRFTIFWQGQKYVYQVRETRIVNPTDTSVEAPTEEPVITLYTCTPLWTAKQRLVIRAERVLAL